MADSGTPSAQPAIIPVCGIGASAGGLEALQAFFSVLPIDLGLAYVIVVHLAPDRKSDLPSIIQRWTSMPVMQVGDHDKVPLEEISHANNDLENLMAATDVATLFLDQGCRISRFTPPLSRIFNVMAHDLGRPISDLAHKLDYPNLERDARKVIATGQHLELDIQDTEGRFYLARFRPYRRPDGETGGVVITFVDMTRIKRAEAALRDSEQRLAEELNVMRVLHATALAITTGATLENAMDEFLGATMNLTGAEYGSVQLLDDDSQLLKIIATRGLGPEFLNVFEAVGIDDESAAARTMRSRKTCIVEDVTQDPNLARYSDVLARAGCGAIRAEPLITKDNEFVGVLSIYYRAPRQFSDRDRQLGGLLALQAADFISGRLKQERLSRINETLLQRTVELEAVHDRLSRQTEDLRAQDQNRERFLAALGHELRNPMAAIKNSIDVITPTDGKSVSALHILERQAAQMQRLINDILDVTRINRGTMRLNLSRFDLKDCVAAAVESVRGQAQTKGLALESELPQVPIIVEGDPERIGQILDNLLRNALNFTARGGITVTVSRSAKEAVVAVRDTGVGVESNRIASIFDAALGSGESSNGSGLGMGLSLVKHLVELHHGGISFRSEGRDRGSEVEFTVPLLAPGSAPTDSGIDRELTSKQILIVDDNVDAADALGLLLENMGHQVAVVYGGESAIEAVGRQRSQVAFIDLSMPEISGSEVARRLRQLFTPAELTLVALSGHSRSHLSAEDAVFDHYLLKPADVESIVTLLKSI